MPTERVFTFRFPHLVTNFPVHVKVQMAARSFVYTYFDLSVNDKTVIDSTLFLKVTPSSHAYAFKANKSATFFEDNDLLNVTIRYYSEDRNAISWLDYIELNVKRELIYGGGQMIFHEPDAEQSGQIARFNIRQVDKPVQIWAITNNLQPKNKCATSHKSRDYLF